MMQKRINKIEKFCKNPIVAKNKTTKLDAPIFEANLETFSAL